METIKINRNGNSKAVNIPVKFCEKLGIELGDFMDCYLSIQDQIVIVRHNKKRKLSWVKEK